MDQKVTLSFGKNRGMTSFAGSQFLWFLPELFGNFAKHLIAVLVRFLSPAISSCRLCDDIVSNQSHRDSASSSSGLALTQRGSPLTYSFFQKGARDFR